jgi:Bacterial regulatory helix-turn-helix protein, lysR family
MEQVMEMHQVRYFLAVVRTGNFTRAAEDCHVSQPSLTRAIKTLEGELGNDLFYRERPGVVLTDEISFNSSFMLELSHSSRRFSNLERARPANCLSSTASATVRSPGSAHPAR